MILIQDRNSDKKIHIVHYTAPNGDKVTLCDLSYNKNEIINTFAANLAIDGICSICHETYQKMYDDDLNYFVRDAHGNLVAHVITKYQYIKDKIWDTKSFYWTLNYRYNEKLNKCIRKTRRPKRK